MKILVGSRGPTLISQISSANHCGLHDGYYVCLGNEDLYAALRG